MARHLGVGGVVAQRAQEQRRESEHAARLSSGKTDCVHLGRAVTLESLYCRRGGNDEREVATVTVHANVHGVCVPATRFLSR